jgi:hypothetical protein
MESDRIHFHCKSNGTISNTQIKCIARKHWASWQPQKRRYRRTARASDY